MLSQQELDEPGMLEAGRGYGSSQDLAGASLSTPL